MLDPALWDLFPDGMPKATSSPAISPARRWAGRACCCSNNAGHPEQVQTGPYKTIQICLNAALAGHFHTLIDSTVADAPAGDAS